METLFESLFESSGFALFVELFLKSSLVLGAALVLSFFTRKEPASARHFLLGLSLVGILFLPFLSTFIPGWKTGMLPSLGQKPAAEIGLAISSDESASTPFDTSRQDRRPRQWVASTGAWVEKEVESRYGIMILWSLVSGFILVKILFGLYGVSRLSRRGISMKGYPWQQLFRLFFKRMALKRNVRLIQNKRVAVPMTWGVLKPVILMPPESSQWPMDQCSSVLFHELSHVKRWDFPVNLLARISCALYWFNPLAWMVFKRLRTEQEKACDEMVLKAGIKPSTYASSLLLLKQAVHKGRPLPSPALGMAGGSEFSERLTAILAKQFKIKEIKMKTKVILSILVFLTVTLIGTARPNPAAAVEKDVAAAAEIQTPGTKQESKATKETKEKKEKKKEKAEKAEKCEEKEVMIIVNKGEEGGEEKVTEIILKPGDSKTKIKGKTIKIDKGYLCIGGSDKECNIKIHCDSEKELAECLKGSNCKVKVDGDKIILSMGKGDGKATTCWIKTKKGVKGGGDKYVFIGTGDDEDEHEIIEIGSEGDEKSHMFILKKGSEKGQYMNMISESQCKLDEKLAKSLKGMVDSLRKDLPKSYDVELKLEEDTQRVSIGCSLDNLDSEEGKKAMKRIDEFQKAFEKAFPGSEGKKSLKKRMHVKIEKEKEKEKDV